MKDNCSPNFNSFATIVVLQSSVDMDIKHVDIFKKQNLVGQGHLPSLIFRQLKKVEKDPESQIVGNNLELYKPDFSFF